MQMKIWILYFCKNTLACHVICKSEHKWVSNVKLNVNENIDFVRLLVKESRLACVSSAGPILGGLTARIKPVREAVNVKSTLLDFHRE